MANAVRAYIFIECNVGSTKEVIEGLKHFKGIKSLETVTGPYDIIAILELEVSTGNWRFGNAKCSKG